MGQLMETIQEVDRGQEIMAKMQEEINQHANASNPPPQGNPRVHIGAPGGVPHTTLNPPVIEIDDHQDAFFSPRAASIDEAFGPPTNEVEKKVKSIEEKVREMESTGILGLDAAKMCLVLGIVIPAKIKVPDFEKYKGASDPRTHIRAYCRKMDAYSDYDRLLMHFFKILKWSILGLVHAIGPYPYLHLERNG